jgi:UDP-glucose:(heptosyl)LPS alpha-1,3-glucosyltransferase
MKLAFCLFNYFPFGGLQRDFLRIARLCLQQGHTIDVYTMEWEGAKEPGLSIHILPPQGMQNHTRRQHFVTELKPRLSQGDYDLVVGFNKMPGLDLYYAADTCYQAKARKQHGWLYRLTRRYKQSVAFEKAVFAPESSTQILVISSLQQPEFMHYYQTPAARFHLLPPGIDKNRIAPPNATAIRHAVRQEYHISDDEFLLLMVGSGFRTKGLDRTLQALAALPPALKHRTRLFIIGDDHAKPFLRQAKQLNISDRVLFLGGRDDVPRFLLAADLLLHPAYNENTGTILLEALVSGLPVLTTDVCGYAKYIIDAQAGCVLSSPFQQAQLNHQLEEMLLSTQQAQWKSNALRFAKNHDLYSLPEKVTDFIEKYPSLRAHALCGRGNPETSPRSPRLSASQPRDDGDAPYSSFFISSEIDRPSTHNNSDMFNQLMSLRGQTFRELEGRRTQRVLWQDQAYFIKQHFGVGWKEIFKNLSQLRLPVVSAKNEWLAIQKLTQLGIPTQEVVGFGCRGNNPARLESFLMTKELTSIMSLEDLCRNWATVPPTADLKHALIREVARMARVMHEHGVNHRDFYICHFLLDLKSPLPPFKAPKLYIIDLHRAQIRPTTPMRWKIKDLAGLYFSSKDIGLTSRDRWRFIKAYCEKPLRDVLTKDSTFWQKVKQRGDKTYQKHGK